MVCHPKLGCCLFVDNFDDTHKRRSWSAPDSSRRNDNSISTGINQQPGGYELIRIDSMAATRTTSFDRLVKDAYIRQTAPTAVELHLTTRSTRSPDETLQKR